MLSSSEVDKLKETFQGLYSTKSSMDLFNILSEVDNYLHKDDPLVRRLAFTTDNWKFRQMLKLRREAIQSEIRRR